MPQHSIIGRCCIMAFTTSQPHIKRPLTQTQNHLIQSRRCMEQHQAFWNVIKDYFNSCNLMSSKHTSWTAPDFYTFRQQQYILATNRQHKKLNLLQRKSKLADLITKEEKMFEERREENNNKSLNTNDIHVFASECKRLERERHDRELELKLYHQWRATQPLFREFSRRQTNHFLNRKQLQEMYNKDVLQNKNKQVLQCNKMEEECFQKDNLQKKEIISSLRKQLFEEINLFCEKEKLSQLLKQKEAEIIELRDEIERIVHKYNSLKQQIKDTGEYKSYSHQQGINNKREFEHHIQKENANCLELIDMQQHMLETYEKLIKLDDDQAKILREDNPILNTEWREENQPHNNKNLMKALYLQVELKLSSNLNSQYLLIEERQELLKKIKVTRKQLKKLEE